MKQLIFNHLKNIPGWRTNRKLVAIAVDDYGNVRLHSKKAREQMDKAGLKVHSRFDAYDTLETREDLEALYEVLESVKDKNGKPAVFTPFALPCNINFEEIKENGYSDYVYELLPQTYNKLSAMLPKEYEGTWELWQEGISKGLMVPQFHGREHFNLLEFKEKLHSRDKELFTAFENRSYTSISNTKFKTRGWTAAFAYWKYNENELLVRIVKDGIDKFKKVFGYSPVHFMAPTSNVSDEVVSAAIKAGVKVNDKAMFEKYHKGDGIFQRRIHFTGQNIMNGAKAMVRNVVFEPTEDKFAVDRAINQIDAAFTWGRPALISSHRVNYCGLIDEENRKTGLNSLKLLLNRIVERHHDVEFVSTELVCNLLVRE